VFSGKDLGGRGFRKSLSSFKLSLKVVKTLNLTCDSVKFALFLMRVERIVGAALEEDVVEVNLRTGCSSRYPCHFLPRR